MDDSRKKRDPGEPSPYRRWRDAKLSACPQGVDALMVDIDRLAKISANEAAELRDRIRRFNMAIYRCRDRTVDRATIHAFAATFGLRRIDRHLCAGEDGVTALEKAVSGRRKRYIPYSNRSLSWHTDGYYNDSTKPIRAILLHCMHAAAAGGENGLLDPEIAYINLYDTDPDFIAALSHPQCMTIPANRESGREIRPARSGPVFSVDPVTGTLHMRFTAREKHVIWRDNAATRAAVAHLMDLLADENGPALRHRLVPGQGIISNNVLHNRAAFDDDPPHQRLVYRARYFDRIETTD